MCVLGLVVMRSKDRSSNPAQRECGIDESTTLTSISELLPQFPCNPAVSTFRRYDITTIELRSSLLHDRVPYRTESQTRFSSFVRFAAHRPNGKTTSIESGRRSSSRSHIPLHHTTFFIVWMDGFLRPLQLQPASTTKSFCLFYFYPWDGLTNASVKLLYGSKQGSSF